MLSNSKTCDNCTKCCDGWITGSVDNQDFFPGKPCKYSNIGIGCKIYESRPDYPCKMFNCLWKLDKSIPDWIKPSLSGFILMRSITKFGSESYIKIIQASNELNKQSLISIFEWVKASNLNAIFDGGFIEYCGSNQFIKNIELELSLNKDKIE